MTETTALDLLAKRVRHLEMLENIAGELPSVDGAGYALVSDAVNSWIADPTPLWTDEHSFEAGVAFVGASDANEIIIPDDTAIALELLDTGGLEYLRIVSTDANPYLLIDPGATGILVGIGCIPRATLEVEGPTSPQVRVTNTGADYSYIIQTNSGGAIVLRDAAGNEDVIIRSYGVSHFMAGNVGVGVIDPDAPVEINSNAAVQLHLHGLDSGVVDIRLTNTTDGAGWYFGLTGTNEDFAISRAANLEADPKFYITQAGNIGIGTATPGSPTEWDLATENLEFVDAGSAAATEQDWIEVQVGNATGYIRVFAAK